MDVFSGLRADLFRVVVTIVIPGSAAVAPWVALLVAEYPGLGAFAEAHTTLATSALLALIVAAAHLVENWGSWVEVLWDAILARDDHRHHSNWNKYLRLAFKTEPVGHRYLRTITLRMKFELNMAVALVVGGIGLNALNREVGLLGPSAIRIASGLIVLVIAYLLYESYASAAVLARVRAEVLKGVTVIGS